MGKKFMAILLGGLAAGALDILYAFVVYGPLSYGLSPMQVLQSVAGGWIGRDAAMAAGDWSAAALGLATHFGIALVMALAYVLIAARAKALTAHAVLWGFVYGLVLYVVMNYVTAPLSAAASGQFPASAGEALQRLQESFSAVRPRYDADLPWMIPATIFTHTALVGVPIALAAKRFLPD